MNSETTPEYVDGLVAFKVPEGEYDIKVHYEGTKSFRITIFGFFIGATGLLVLTAIDLFYFGQRNRKYINDINTLFRINSRYVNIEFIISIKGR